MKYIVNTLTGSRILLSLLLILTPPFSRSFYVLYLCCGISDMLDGYLARKTGTASEKGAILDSIADIVFLIAAAVCILPALTLPLWLLIGALGIALVRIVSYVVGFMKYKAFASLHTYLNKTAGLLLFTAPLLLILLGLNTTGIILITITMISALEELIIILMSDRLDRNTKSVFSSYS